MTAEKVEIVKQHATIYGRNTTLDTIGMPKRTWYHWKNQEVDDEKRYAHLREPVLEIPSETTG